MRLTVVILALAGLFSNGVNGKRVKRIAGGGRVEIEYAPYMAMIRDYTKEGPYGHVCGGVIITNKHILSAAHCFAHNENDLMELDFLDNIVVVTGDDMFTSRSQLNEIEVIYIHQDFRGNHFPGYQDKADVAIIRLVDELVFGANRQAVELATEIPLHHIEGFIFGWGAPAPGSPNSRTLQGLQVHYFSLAACSWVFPFSAFTNDEGDSGGPLIIDQKLLGIISHGSYHCDGLRPIGLASVVYYTSWIKDVIDGKIKFVYPKLVTTSELDVTEPCLLGNSPPSPHPRRHSLSCPRIRKKVRSKEVPKKFM
ncbi:trypsin epsilon-like [Diachasmimorpha longicaudata]|uniref:trypsin epsilon-like n=1 Tax=Diachasmimorpha longicaudata TaxID=58733 RepID=UPI0030B8FAB5